MKINHSYNYKTSIINSKLLNILQETTRYPTIFGKQQGAILKAAREESLLILFMRVYLFILFYLLMGIYVYAQPGGSIETCPRVQRTITTDAGVQYRFGVFNCYYLDEFKNMKSSLINYSGYTNTTYYSSCLGNSFKYIIIWIYYPLTNKLFWYTFDTNNGKGWIFENNSLGNGQSTTVSNPGGIKLWVKNPDNSGKWTSSEVLFKFYEE